MRNTVYTMNTIKKKIIIAYLEFYNGLIKENFYIKKVHGFV